MSFFSNNSKVNQLSASLAEIVTETGIDLNNPPNDSQTINQAYPSVTLVQVQSLNPTATLSDSASWYYLQNILKSKNIQFYNFGNKHITIRGGIYSLSKPLDLSILGNVDIDLSGVCLQPFGSYTGYLVQLHNSDRSVPKVKNLYIDGLYKSNGLSVDWASFYTFTDMYITHCVTGLNMAATWYGSFEGICTIKECVYGIVFSPSLVDSNTGSWEVNTINFLNFDIGGASTTQITNNFLLPSNTDVIGVNIKCRSLGVKFIGLTIEGTDIAYNIDDSLLASSLNCEIVNNYFEVNRKYILYQGITNILSRVNLQFNNCLLNPGGVDSDCKISIAQGVFNIMGMNNNLPKISIRPFSNYRPLILTTNIPSSLIDDQGICGSSQIYSQSKPLDTVYWNTQNYSSDYSQANNPPRLEVINQTIQDELGYVSENHASSFQPAGTLNTRVKYKAIHSPSVKDLFFIDSTKGVVLSDRTNGKIYRLYVSNGVLSVEEEKSPRKVTNYVNVKPIEFFINTTDYTLSGKYRLDMQDPTLGPINAVNSKWITVIGGSNIPIFGTSADYKTGITGNVGYGAIVYNKEIKAWYCTEDTYWGWGAPLGINNFARLFKRAVGTTAQRPTGLTASQTFFIYYDTDIQGYVKWDGAVWQAYTPS